MFLHFCLNLFFAKVVVRNWEPEGTDESEQNVSSSSFTKESSSFSKEFALVGRDNKEEKLHVMKRPSLFNKNLKVVSEKTLVVKKIGGNTSSIVIIYLLTDMYIDVY